MAVDNLGGSSTSMPVNATVSPPSMESTPFSGTPTSVPGTIEAEQFDNGGEGVAYHDLTAGNAGGQYRATDVDIEATTDVGGGYDVGWTSPGEWLNYTINVTTAGTYTLDARVACPGTGGTFHLEINGARVTGAGPSGAVGNVNDLRLLTP